MQLENTTDTAAILFRSLDARGEEHATCVAKRCYDIVDQGDAVGSMPRRVPSTWTLADEYGGSAHERFLRRENDLSPTKPATDIYFVDPVAMAPEGRPAPHWSVQVSVGRLDVGYLVCGPRIAERRLLGWRVPRPSAVSSVPMDFRHAYGGSSSAAQGDALSSMLCNPVGRGLGLSVGPRSKESIPLPQVARGRDLIDTPLELREASSLGPVARAWSPRRERAGNFTEPYEGPLPADHDERFYNAATDALTYDGYLRGDERVVLSGLSAQGEMSFRLPGSISFGLLTRRQDGSTELAAMQLDTVVIDVAARKLDLCWRGRTALDSASDFALASFPREVEVSDAA